MKGVGGKYLYFKLGDGELPRLRGVICKGASDIMLGTELAWGQRCSPRALCIIDPAASH